MGSVKISGKTYATSSARLWINGLRITNFVRAILIHHMNFYNCHQVELAYLSSQFDQKLNKLLLISDESIGFTNKPFSIVLFCFSDNGHI